MEVDGLATGTLGRSGFCSSASSTGYSSRAPPHCATESGVSPDTGPRSSLAAAAPTDLGLPRRFLEDEVEDKADPPRPDDIVVIQEVAPLTVLGARHVGLAAAEGTASGDILEKVTELGAVEGVAELEQGGQEGEFRGGEAGQVGQVAGLVDLRAGVG